MWRDIGRYIDTDLNEVELFQSLVIIQGARIIERSNINISNIEQ